MILLVQRLDKQLIFDFYNLSNPKYYSKFFPFELPNIIKTNPINNNSNNANDNNSKEEIKKNDNSPVAPSFFGKVANYFNSFFIQWNGYSIHNREFTSIIRHVFYF